MPQSSLSLTQKKEFAEVLYCERKLNHNIAAKKVGVTPKTFGEWVKKYGWEKKRKRLLISREQQLARFYDQLDMLNQSIENRGEGKNFPNSKEADAQLKLTAAIRNLEIELSIGDKIKSMMDFIKFIQKTESPAVALEVINHCDGFIQSIIA